MDSFVVSGSYDHTIRIWEMGSGKQMASIAHNESQVNTMSLTENAMQLGVGGWQRLGVYDMQTMAATPLLSLDALAHNVTAIGFQVDGRWMYAGGEDKACRIFDMRGTQLVCNRDINLNSAVNSVVLNANQMEMFIADASGGVWSWDVRTNVLTQMPFTADPFEQVIRLSMHPLGHMLIAITSNGRLLRWRLSEMSESEYAGDGSRDRPPLPIKVHSAHALSCRFSPDAKLIVTSAAEDNMRTVDGRTGEVMDEIHCGRWAYDTPFTADSRRVVAACEARVGEGGKHGERVEGQIQLLDIVTSRPLVTYEGHHKPVTAICAFDR